MIQRPWRYSTGHKSKEFRPADVEQESPRAHTSPGRLVIRDSDKHIGMIIIAREPHGDQGVYVNWTFQILIDNTLIITDDLGYHFSVV